MQTIFRKARGSQEKQEGDEENGPGSNSLCHSENNEMSVLIKAPSFD